MLQLNNVIKPLYTEAEVAQQQQQFCLASDRQTNRPSTLVVKLTNHGAFVVTAAAAHSAQIELLD